MSSPLSMKTRIIQFGNKYWFLIALLGISLTTVAGRSEVLFNAGRFIRDNHGPDLVMALVFLFSGFTLNVRKVKEGLLDLRGTVITLVAVFLVAPSLAAIFSLLPLDEEIVKGLFLVSVMPSTLSSGVVMTAAAGGNAAHALLATIISNSLSTVTIPLSLTMLLGLLDQSVAIHINNLAILGKIFYLAILPLCAGMMGRSIFPSLIHRWEKEIIILCQFFVLFVVWVAISQTGEIISNSGSKVFILLFTAAAYHASLLIGCWGMVLLSGRKKGKRESIIFIGGQKTLPLSIILQMSIFPDSGMVLIVCVLHHIIHLIMDAYLVEKLNAGN